MRRLRQWIAIGFACAAIVLCGVAFTDHKPAPQSGSESVACSAACHSHGQPVGGQAGTLLNQQDDDKEPTPPVGYWLLGVFAIALLYRAPVAASYTAWRPRHLYLAHACLRF